MTADTPENFPGHPETELDWENRSLCPDDSCIGAIGADGRCRVCGLLDPKSTGVPDLSLCNSGAADEPRAPHSVDQAPETREEPGWEDRKLCSDESCIGTIGADGRCRICGLPG